MSGSARRRTPAGRWYAVLVGVFPRDLAHRYGGEMIEAFEREVAAVRVRRGRLAAGLFVVRASADAIQAGLGHRRRRRGRRFADPRQRVRLSGRARAWTGGLAQDLKVAARTLGRKPGFAVLVVLTLALGIGVNTAMFSTVYGVLLRPLPYPDPDALVSLYTGRANRSSSGGISEPEFVDLVEHTTSFGAIGLMRGVGINLAEGEGDPEYIDGFLVTAGVFDALGARPALGRPLDEAEGLADGPRAALISDGLWRRRFGADPGVVGRSLRMLDETYEIVGVMPAGFAFPDAETGIWLGYGLDPVNPRNRGAHLCSIIARLSKGASIARAQADVDALSARLREIHQDIYKPGSGFHFVVASYLDDVTGSVRPALTMLMIAVGLVLLIACANVANLFLVRAAGRGREFAVRASLGAGRARILRQLLTESLLVGVLAGVLAVAVAWWAFGALATLHPDSLPRMREVRLDTPVLLFNAGLVALATMAVGSWPALWVSGALRPGRGPGAAGLLTARTLGGGRSRGRAALVVGEVALAAVLLVGAGLVVGSLERLADAKPGFQAERVLTARVTLPPERYADNAARAAFYRRLMDGLSAEPDVVSAAVVNFLPESGVIMDWYVGAEGYVPAGPNVDFVQYRTVAPGYFTTLGIPVLRGRAFTAGDDAEAQPVAILSEALAKRFWGDQDPIGRRVRPGGVESSSPWHVVVGIVGDIQHSGPRQGDVPIWYRSAYQDPWDTMSLAVRTAGDPARAARLVKDAVARIDPRQPVYQVRVMTELERDILSPDRLNANLLGLFAGLALALAAIGIYGVLAYEVGRRTHEIGVRMALGARAGQVLRDVVGQGLTLVVAGLGLGLAGALALSRLLRSLLFGIDAYDPATFAGVAVVLLGAGLLACLLPARRALRVDPLIALRQE